MDNDNTANENKMIAVDLNDADAFNDLLDQMGINADGDMPDAFLNSGTYESIVSEAKFILEDFQNADEKPTIAIFKYDDGYQYDIIGDKYKDLSLFNNDLSNQNVVSIMKWDNGNIVEQEISAR